MLGEQSVALDTIDTETLEFTSFVDETEAITVGKLGYARHGKRLAANLLYLSYLLSHRFGRVEARNIRLATLQKIVCISSVERFVEIG